jgi:hypothetical protein
LQTPGSASAAGEQLAEADGVGLEQARAARLLGVPRLAPSRHVRQGRQSDMLSTACRHSELIPGGAAVPCASAITSASARASADAKNNRSAATEVEFATLGMVYACVPGARCTLATTPVLLLRVRCTELHLRAL